MELGWREIAALWGAGLSTVLAFLKFLPLAPQFAFEPETGTSSRPYCHLKVSNPGKSTLYFRTWKRIALRGGKDGLQIATCYTPMDKGVGTDARYAVGPNGELSFHVIASVPEDLWLVIWSWHRGWMLPLRLPCLMVISGARIGAINAAIRK